MRSIALVWVILGACGGEDATSLGTNDWPLGLERDAGVLYAGAANLDVTPNIAAKDTWTDLNGNFDFDGDWTDPAASVEPWVDVNGNGYFDPVFIGGFGFARPGIDVREGDPITTRAMLLARDSDLLAIVSLDLVGLTHVRIDAAAERLRERGLPIDRLLVTTTHNHQGPDAVGLWGAPLNGISGVDVAYQERLVTSIVDAVQAAADTAVPAHLTVGAVQLRDLSVWFNGAAFGGKNPTRKMHGLLHDKRDPVLVSDQVLAVQARSLEDDETVVTLMSHSAHPEVRGSSNNTLASDYVGVARQVVEAHFGGITVHVPESLGGMQSALGGDVPLVTPEGEHVMQTCDEVAVADPNDPACFGQPVDSVRIDEDGDEVPVWAPRDSWEIVNSQGWHVGEAVIAAIEGGEALDPTPFRVEMERDYVPIRNWLYETLGPSGIFDIDLASAVTDPALCPAAPETELGCLPFGTFRVQLGTLGLVTAPGELLPELAWGLPEGDAVWDAEATSREARGPDAIYFPQHDEDCDTVDEAVCLSQNADLGDCRCVTLHTTPYRLSDRPGDTPLLSRFGPEVTYRAAMSSTSTYISYIIPQPDFHTDVNQLFGDQGDHYEETVSPAFDFAERLFDAQARIDERW